jgi:3-hydroxyisobutyrate dehydrogenase-like beta-hydroxyacid dehydrogenase
MKESASPGTTVAVLGLGIMGEPMARNLLRGGFPTRVWNRTAARGDALVAEGAVRCATPAEACREAEFTVAMVADPPALDAVMHGPEGALAGLQSGSVLINMGTQAIAQIEALAMEAHERGVAFVDAPVTGSRSGAVDGTLTILAGAEASVLERTLPVLMNLGKTVLPVGNPGDGTRAKLILNLIQSGMLTVWAEGLALGKRVGLSPALLSQVLEHSAGNSGLFRYKSPFLLRRDFSTNFSLKLMDKDIKLALDEAARLEADLPAGATVSDVFSDAMAAGFGDDDFLSIARTVEARAKTKIEP